MGRGNRRRRGIGHGALLATSCADPSAARATRRVTGGPGTSMLLAVALVPGSAGTAASYRPRSFFARTAAWGTRISNPGAVPSSVGIVTWSDRRVDRAVTVGILLRSDYAAPPRTLLDVLDRTVEAHPEAAAVDDGNRSITYGELSIAVESLRGRLHAAGVGPGDRVGIRLPSGTADLYLAILGVLAAGAAYVPVDLDDPDERAELVFAEAGVAAVLSGDMAIAAATPRAAPAAAGAAGARRTTRGSSSPRARPGRPKGVAVTHRSRGRVRRRRGAAVPAGRADRPGRPGARPGCRWPSTPPARRCGWRGAHGACLVPAPRALVRSGMDLGPWLVAQRHHRRLDRADARRAVAGEALTAVRLLIFGGEACPPELAERLVASGREVWNTYGPTEATVVACAARLDRRRAGAHRAAAGRLGPRRRRTRAACRSPTGEVGELIIGGVGLARYLDPAKDAEKFAPMPTPRLGRGPTAAATSCASTPRACVFVGRADDQVKLGGRRIELGEVDAALQALPGVAGAAAAVRTTPRRAPGPRRLPRAVRRMPSSTSPPLGAARAEAAGRAGAAARPWSTRSRPATSGKVDRDALPWPLPGARAGAERRRR